MATSYRADTQSLALGIPWEARILAKAKIFQALGYKPSAPQRVIHFAPNRIRAMSGGERSGKSYMGGKEVVGECALGDLYWVVGPNYELARPEFTYIVEDLHRLGAIEPDSLSFPKEGPCSVVTVWGTHIVTKSSVDTEKLGAVPPDGILMTEAAQHDYDAFVRLSARTAQKRGWLLLTGTLEQAIRWYAESIISWLDPNNPAKVLAVIAPTSTNLSIFPGGENDPELLYQKQRLGEDIFAERFGGKPVPPRGLVFPEIVKDLGKYFGEVEYKEGIPVELGIDPGWENPYSVLMIQVIPATDKKPMQINVIDELYERFNTTKRMQKLLMARPWADKITQGAIDYSARGHKDSDKTTLMQWGYPYTDDDGWKWKGIPMMSRYIGIQAGIDRFRSLAENMRFSVRCAGLYNEFFHYKFQQMFDKKWDTKPIDAYNHSIKGLTYWLVNRFGLLTPDSTGNGFSDFSFT